MNRCETAQCCKAFPLPVSPEELHDPTRNWEDGLTIPAMVVYLGERDVTDIVTGEKGRMHYYSCTHLMEDNNCAIYESRPGMCRRYPNNRPCDHRDNGCTYKPELVTLKGRDEQRQESEEGQSATKARQEGSRQEAAQVRGSAKESSL